MNQSPLRSLLTAQVQSRPLICLYTAGITVLSYALLCGLCALLAGVLGLLSLGMGWALVYGDDLPPHWFNVALWIMGMSITFGLPLLPSYLVARRTYRRLVRPATGSTLPPAAPSS